MYNILIEFEMNSCCKQVMIVDGKGRKLELANSWEKMECFDALRNLTMRGNEQTKPNPTITSPDKHYLFNVGGLWKVLQIIFIC